MKKVALIALQIGGNETEVTDLDSCYVCKGEVPTGVDLGGYGTKANSVEVRRRYFESSSWTG